MCFARFKEISRFVTFENEEILDSENEFPVAGPSMITSFQNVNLSSVENSELIANLFSQVQQHLSHIISQNPHLNVTNANNLQSPYSSHIQQLQQDTTTEGGPSQQLQSETGGSAPHVQSFTQHFEIIIANQAALFSQMSEATDTSNTPSEQE